MALYFFFACVLLACKFVLVDVYIYHVDHKLRSRCDKILSTVR